MTTGERGSQGTMEKDKQDIHSRDEIENDLLVADYVAGRLDDETRKELEERLKNDDDLLARVIEERGFRAHAGEGQVEESTADEEAPVGDEPVKRASPWRRSAIVATLIAAAFVAFYMERPGGDDVMAGNEIRVVFAPGTSEAERAETASELGFEIASGPDPSGVFMVTALRALDAEEVAAWRDDPRIESADPVGPEP